MNIRKWWLESILISGAEGEGDGGGSGDGAGGDGGTGGTSGDQNQQQNEGGSENEGGDEGGDDDKETYSKEDVAKLRKALQTERQQRRDLQKAQRDAANKQQSDQAKADADAKDKALQESNARLEKLAAGFRTSRVEQAITAAAQAAKAIAPEDVVALLKANNFDGIDIEQDPDDPTKVTIDETDLKNAVKSILKTRPHWVQGAGDGNPSGGQFRPGGQRQTTDDEALKAQYPFLANRV